MTLPPKSLEQRYRGKPVRRMHVMVKPTGALCNLDCSYCYYLSKQELLGKCEGFPAYVAERLSAVKWRNWKAHFIWQENMYDPPLRLPVPKLINLLTDLKEERDVCAKNDWVLQPMVKIIGELEASFKKYPPIKVGTPDPYTPPKE